MNKNFIRKFYLIFGFVFLLYAPKNLSAQTDIYAKITTGQSEPLELAIGDFVPVQPFITEEPVLASQIKEIVKKSDLSDSQVYNTLKSLQSIGLVISPSRGIYSIPKTQFVEKLGEAYLPQLVQLIGKEMYLLGKDLDKIPFVELDRRFSLLVDRWEPLIDTHFRAKASFLAEHILQRAG